MEAYAFCRGCPVPPKRNALPHRRCDRARSFKSPEAWGLKGLALKLAYAARRWNFKSNITQRKTNPRQETSFRRGPRIGQSGLGKKQHSQPSKSPPALVKARNHRSENSCNVAPGTIILVQLSRVVRSYGVPDRQTFT